MSDEAIYSFRLYVAGNAQNSLAAIIDLRSFCERYLPARHEIQVIDILHEPKRAVTDGVLMTPMLVKLAPGAVRKIVGSLSETVALLRALELPVPAA